MQYVSSNFKHLHCKAISLSLPLMAVCVTLLVACQAMLILSKQNSTQILSDLSSKLGIASTEL